MGLNWEYPLLSPLFFLIFLITWFFFPSSSKHQDKLLPSPPKFPIIGNLLQLGSFPHRSLQSFSQKYGPHLMLLHFGSKPVVVASSAEAASEIMKTHDAILADRPKTIAQKLFYNSKDVAFTHYGEYWRQMRSICVLQLLSNQRVQSFRSVREEEIALMIEKIKQSCHDDPNDNSSSSKLINLSEMLATLTNDIVCRVALGRKFGDEESGKKAKIILKEFIQILGDFDIGFFIPWLSWINRLNGLNAKVDRIIKSIDTFIEGVIEEHENKATSCDQKRDSDFVDILLETQRENLTGFRIERDSVKALILDMFAGGTDTTLALLEWMMAELLKHPKILETLQTEVRNISRGKPDITEEDLDKMPYLKAVIKETLRLHPPVTLLVRQSIEHVKLLGYDIPAGTQVIVNIWAIQRDPNLWEYPEEFRPERFLNSKIDFRGFNFELIPFGAGRRGCPGINSAMATNELALAKLVHEFDFSLPTGITPEDLDMSEVNGIAVHKKVPLHAVVTLAR
ncbi:OLC1v1035126C1 [Oldenlandia corymbosa var. corymbosa]|uniref:OLC1v1035126C1 n=1 Tax=Oldenlandia corymbosa var. corymbosa TaxID=529605 RepID=A0AAV1CU06_OLDCO|nr:OLC1v1035126C1 [Oldenlandia corymbosa var. corymbosa]